MFGQEHVVEWCEQVADQTANGSLEGLFDWLKVCVTNKSEVELHMLDRELLSVFYFILWNLLRKEELSALLGWRMVYSTMQVLAEEGLTIGEVPRKASPEGKVWHPSGLFRLSRRCMMGTVTWTAGPLKLERERPGSVWPQCRTRL